MSDAQIFQVIGLVYAAMGVGALLRPQTLRKMLDDYAGNAGLLQIGAMMALVVGYLLVAVREPGTGWSIVLTVFGWLGLIKGVLLLLVPGVLVAMSRWLMQRPGLVVVQAIAITVIGAGMLVLGFCVV